MLYSLLKPIIRLSLLAFFRKVNIIGKENIPKTGPVIFVANHPSAVIDPLVVAVSIKRKIHFLAGAEWFGKGLKAIIFKKQLNMIPVYRPWKAKTKDKSNIDMFKDCYQILANGGCIVLFPEASSQTISKIRELKTGAIRIKKGFEDLHGHIVEVPIIPIGLNYSDAHEFQSELLVNIGGSIKFSENQDPDPAEQVIAMTLEIEEALKETIVNISEDENQPLVDKVNRMFIETIREDVLGNNKDVAANFRFEQDIAKGVEHFKKHDESNFKSIAIRLNAYFDRLSALGVSDDTVNQRKQTKAPIWTILSLIITSPIGLLSSILFFVPFTITKRVFFNKLKPKIANNYDVDDLLNPSFTGSLIFTSGMIIFMLWTLTLAIITGFIFHAWEVALIVFVLGYPLFQFGLYYSYLANKVRASIEQRKLIRKYSAELLPLQKERRKLLEIFKKYRSEYDSLTL